MNDITIYNYNPFPIQKHIPIGQLYIVSTLRENGYDVDFRDFQLLDSPKREMYNIKSSLCLRELKFSGSPKKGDLLSFFENSSDIIGMSCMSPLLPSMVLLVRELKKKHPEKTIIVGGPGPACVAEDILKTAPVDVVVSGEGEKTIVELVDCLEKNRDLKNVRGISYRDGKKIRTNPPRPRIKDLDKIPFPAYDKIDINEYRMGIMTSRGCPYRCGFCCRGFLWGDKMTFRSIDNVIEEIRLVYEKYNKKRITIFDDIFPLNRKRVFDFCDKLKKEKIDIDWLCYSRVDLMGEEIMKKMSEGGCEGILYGIESGSDKILKKINKGFSIRMAKDVLTKSKKYFPRITASFIWGFPFETIEDFEKTIRLVKKFIFELKVNVKLDILRPEIGTPIYNDYKNSIVPAPAPYFIISLIRLLHNGEDIFEIFKNNPSITINYNSYKTPDFYQKMKIMKEFIKGNNLMFRL